MNRVKKLAMTGAATLAVSGLMPVGAAQAYCALPALAWDTNNLSIRSASNVPQYWDGPMAAAANQWNGITGANWSVSWKNKDFIGPVMAWVYWEPLGPGYAGVPGVTDLMYDGTTIWAGDIYLNADFSWNTSGTMHQTNKQADVRTIMVHELGHEVYLNHPSSTNCDGALTGEEASAAMHPSWTMKWYTNADDKAGAAARK